MLMLIQDLPRISTHLNNMEILDVSTILPSTEWIFIVMLTMLLL